MVVAEMVVGIAGHGSAVRIFCTYLKIALLKVFKLSASPCSNLW